MGPTHGKHESHHLMGSNIDDSVMTWDPSLVSAQNLASRVVER